MRSLWTAATGMKAQQFNIDTISNNLANVNTTSYKVQRAEFKDLFYANIKRANINDDQGRPVNLEVGHGVMPVATKRDFRTSSFMETQGTYDFAINGEGFFAVELPNGDIRYTRDGSFKLSIDGDEATLVTSEGYFVLSEDDDLITIETGIKDITVDELGYIYGKDEDDETVEIGRLMLVNFMNPEGLQSEGQNLYRATAASGEEILLEAEEMSTRVIQGYLEASNVQVVDEMVKMITAQRAYEINSKTITTSDEMLQLANNLKR
ncbi:flagellar basal-body rod protein FlgG [Tissierella carlieri]|jgi:flagellar basal-body rod protein FlgG|uniref:Flagellar basal-body rod protein FlgG n=1 Tax=Tissierella carlieri TaxID=689904 RepID=A0ABT1S9P5_9FIRM|nr:MULTISPECIES: flagellar basal-body rod protein FlgG [Tissierella]MBU5310731.1 flagellar basal-body rod protein FlgG [Tissierella carlieri]MCQ4923195.1 flagellar basal-body rod protein FlgG [Tissierella carlieri]MDU5079786.1 flagellar basal-body rod protein FlgG [Bacillota bacterium]OZV13425.1 flagellar basal-body rod protein FlgG [Tissierella sp. P1]